MVDSSATTALPASSAAFTSGWISKSELFVMLISYNFSYFKRLGFEGGTKHGYCSAMLNHLTGQTVT
jgi:hypothetical protein